MNEKAKEQSAMQPEPYSANRPAAAHDGGGPSPGGAFQNFQKDFYTIFDSVPAMIWYHDRNGIIQRANRCAADSVGVPVKELIGKNYYELFPYGAAAAQEKSLQVIFSGSPLLKQLREYRDHSGQTRWALMDRIPFRNERDEITGVIVFAQDVTEQKLAEDRLHESRGELEVANQQLKITAERSRILAEEATVANRAKSEFLANMSHELRTPLNAILGFADVLSEEPMTEEQQRYIKVIRQSADGLLRLVNDILDFSRVEAGKLHIDVQPCNLDELMCQIRDLMEPGIRKKGLEFMMDVPPASSLDFYTDSLRLRQCLLNLIGNAVKFTESGYVAVRIRQEPRGGQQSLRFDVEDTGIGIEEEKLDLIFDSFAQADHSTTRKYGGTGLGLAITRRLAGLLGGHVEVRSRVGLGSTFSIILPLFTQAVRPSAPAAPKPPQTREPAEEDERNFGCVGRVLLIEENPPSQLHLTLQLRRGGLEIQSARSLQRALLLLEKEPFDLILLDWNDPQTAAALKDFLDTRKLSIPLVGVIESGDPAALKEFQQAGCSSVLVEPVTRRQLYETIRSYLIQQKAVISSSRSEAAREMSENLEELFEKLPKIMQGMMEVFARSDLDMLQRFTQVLMDMGDACGRDLLTQKAEKLMKLLEEKPVQTNQVEDTLQELHQLCMQISMHC